MFETSVENVIPNRVRFLNLVAVSTLLFPKAGVNLNGIPITLNLLLIGILIIDCTMRYMSDFGKFHFIYFSLMIPWLILCQVRSDILAENRTVRFGSVYWFLIVPLFWLSIELCIKAGHRIAPKIILYCSFGATLFGVCQFFLGLNFLRVNGVTIAWGDSYESKNLNIFESSFSVGTKIPSTFQGGNIWGQCSALILIWVVVFKMWKSFNSRILQFASVFSPCIAVFLSFSRTAVVTSLLCLGLYFLRDRKWFIKIAVYILAIFFLFSFSSRISGQRYSIESFSNSAGRSSQWKEGLSRYSVGDWLFGRSTTLAESSFSMEGLLGLFSQVGIVGFSLILLLWLKIFNGKYVWLGIGMLVCLILDSTYLTPPLLLIPSILKMVNLQVVYAAKSKPR